MKSKISVMSLIWDHMLDVEERMGKKWLANRDAVGALQRGRVDQTLGNMPEVAKLLT
jgi:hypothetical protein